jgi:ubiquinone/menaquinone biosynthesis C-methylase UbiE
MDFASQLLTTFNNGALCLMISIGHRTGLFDVMSGMAPATSAEIAAAAKLNERYVREWLGAMVTGRVVEYDAASKKYKLPPEHAAFLTRAAGADNLASILQYIGELGSVETLIVDCFHNGGGVPYEKFPRFHEVMAEDSGQSVMSSLESHIVPLVPGLHDKFTAGIRMLDVGCGRGRIITRLAELYPKSTFVGLDLSPEPIAWGGAQAAAKGLRNVEFIEADATSVDQRFAPGTFDLIATFDAIHDQAKPLDVLKGIQRALKPDGVYLMQEIKGSTALERNMEHPVGTALYTISCMHCMTVSLAQGGEGLGAMWGEEKAREYLVKAGFGSVEKNELAHDIQNDWYVIRR